MQKEIKKMSIRGYAKHLEISDKSVRNAIRDGLINKGVQYFTNPHGKVIRYPLINPEIADYEWGNIHKTGKVRPGQNREKKYRLEFQKNGIRKAGISTQFAGGELSKSGDLVRTGYAGTHPANDHGQTVEFLLSLAINPGMKAAEITHYRQLISLAIDKVRLQIFSSISSQIKV